MEVDNPLLYTQHFMWTVRQIKKTKRDGDNQEMVEKTQLGILQVLPAGSDQRTRGLDHPDMHIDNHRMWRGRVVEQVGRT